MQTSTLIHPLFVDTVSRGNNDVQMAWFSKFSYTHLMLIYERSFYVKDALKKTFENISF